MPGISILRDGHIAELNCKIIEPPGIVALVTRAGGIPPGPP